MKKYTLILLMACLGFLFSCGSDNSSDPNKSAYACQMNIAGDVNVDFKSNDVILLPATEEDNNPKVSIKMTDSDGSVHQL